MKYLFGKLSNLDSLNIYTFIAKTFFDETGKF